MVEWNINSNACDVLELGPRAAGRLARLGVRTVAELLTLRPDSAGDRHYSSATIAGWQREARLRVELSDLPARAARWLAGLGIANRAALAHCSPTHLMTRLETLESDQQAVGWLVCEKKPTVDDVCRWIATAQSGQAKSAA